MNARFFEVALNENGIDLAVIYHQNDNFILNMHIYAYFNEYTRYKLVSSGVLVDIKPK
jgi:hypothetical protein